MVLATGCIFFSSFLFFIVFFLKSRTEMKKTKKFFLKQKNKDSLLFFFHSLSFKSKSKRMEQEMNRVYITCCSFMVISFIFFMIEDHELKRIFSPFFSLVFISFSIYLLFKNDFFSDKKEIEEHIYFLNQNEKEFKSDKKFLTYVENDDRDVLIKKIQNNISFIQQNFDSFISSEGQHIFNVSIPNDLKKIEEMNLPYEKERTILLSIFRKIECIQLEAISNHQRSLDLEFEKINNRYN